MRFLLFLFVGLLILSCKTEHPRVNEINDLGGDTVDINYAKSFRIIDYQSFVEIQLIEPQNDSVIARYGIGGEVPDEFIELPQKMNSIAALSSTHVGMLKALDAADKIMGVSSKKYLCNQESQEGWIDYGELGQTDPELYVSHKPDLLVHSGFNTEVPVLSKLQKIGISTFVNYDWKEVHPLGRAEWIKVFGCFLDCREKATHVFDSICTRYEQLKRTVIKVADQPTVLSGTVYGDVFNSPAGESYMAQLLADANTNYVYANTSGTASLSMSLEEVILANRETEYWVNVAADSYADVSTLNKRFEALKSFKNENLYTYYGNVNCFWEQSAISPDKVLSDLIHIFHPGVLNNSTLHYYERISE